MDVCTPHALIQERFSTILVSYDEGTYNESCRDEIDFKSKITSQESSPKVDSSVRDVTESRSVASRLEAKSRVQSTQRAVEGNDLHHGKLEYFEICEITPKVQCHNSLTYCTKDIVNCTCGICLRPSDKIRNLKKDRFEVLSIPNSVIKKGPSYGARHGNAERQRIYHAAHVSCKKAKKNGYKIHMDSTRVLVIENHKSTSDETKNTAHATMRLQMKITPFSLQRESAWDVKILGCSCSTVHVRSIR